MALGPMTAPPKDSPSRIALSLAMALLAFGLYSTMDMMVKLVSARLRVTQLLFLGSAFALVPLMILVWRSGGWPQLKTQRLKWHLLRGVIGMLGGACSYYAYSRMPLADAYAIAFSAPLFITMLSVPLLREHVGWRRWTAVAVGFVGIIIMLRPGRGAIGLGSLAALGGALGYAASVLLMRHMRITETAAAQMVYPTVVSLLGMGFLMPWVWTPPTLLEWALLAATGTCGGTAGICLVTAYRGAPATVVAPFQYTQMLWGMGYGFVIWSQRPDRQMLLGAAVVICTGIYILHRETIRHPSVSSAAKGGLGVGAPVTSGQDAAAHS
jgi:drug/metabolite transporter (DMT)-like permease